MMIYNTSRVLTMTVCCVQVLLVPGSSFVAGSPPSPYVRAAFSTATPADIDIALERLSRVLKAARQYNDTVSAMSVDDDKAFKI